MPDLGDIAPQEVLLLNIKVILGKNSFQLLSLEILEGIVVLEVDLVIKMEGTTHHKPEATEHEGQRLNHIPTGEVVDTASHS